MNLKPIENLLQKKVSRREFLSYVGAAVLAITGIAGLLKTLSSHSSFKKQTTGYGSGAYGGRSKDIV